jgi:hypothetical protein
MKQFLQSVLGRSIGTWVLSLNIVSRVKAVTLAWPSSEMDQ